jgi:Ion transport protein
MELYQAEKGVGVLYPITHVCHLVLQYLEQLGQEFFTIRTKGGAVVLGFFFFLAYVLGVAFWWKTSEWPLVSSETGTTSECDTLQHCFLIMMRLSFWDGSGFDYLLSLMNANKRALVFLLVAYMCLSAMVLLNGLIGIFASAFQAATADDDDADDASKSDADNGKMTAKIGDIPLVLTPVVADDQESALMDDVHAKLVAIEDILAAARADLSNLRRRRAHNVC